MSQGPSPAADAPLAAVLCRARAEERAGHAVIATDAAGSVVYWGATAVELYGWSSEEVVGRDILDVTVSELDRREGTEILRRLKRGRTWSGEFPVRTRTGARFTAHVTNIPVLVDDRLVGIVGVSHRVAYAPAAEGRRQGRD